MSTVEEIARTISNLSAHELARFRRWFEEFDAARFDARIAHDAKSGNLDRLAGEAIAEFHAGRAREL